MSEVLTLALWYEVLTLALWYGLCLAVGGWWVAKRWP